MELNGIYILVVEEVRLKHSILQHSLVYIIHDHHDNHHQDHRDHLRRTDLIQSALTDVSTQNREKTLEMNIVSGGRFFTNIYDTAKSVSKACINIM